jgi:hypothetical protein
VAIYNIFAAVTAFFQNNLFNKDLRLKSDSFLLKNKNNKQLLPLKLISITTARYQKKYYVFKNL